MIIYDKRNGKIITKVPNLTDVDMLFFHYPFDFKEHLLYMEVEELPLDFSIDGFIIVNNELIRKPEDEINPPVPDPIPTPEQIEIAELKEQVFELNSIINTMLGVDVDAL